eukprot:242443-Prorocentrum_lima.AAC.1
MSSGQSPENAPRQIQQGTSEIPNKDNGLGREALTHAGKDGDPTAACRRTTRMRTSTSCQGS